jgi:tripartite-type tricarboxylate transporter receptor subunit TctC
VARSEKEPEVLALMQTLGLEPAASTPDEFARYIRSETAKWVRVIRDANIKVEVTQ